LPDALRQPTCGSKELKMKKLFVRFMQDSSGATAVLEHLLAAEIS
jgi:hypothetical protein